MLSSNIVTWPGWARRDYQKARDLGYNHADAVRIVQRAASGEAARVERRRQRERKARRRVEREG